MTKTKFYFKAFLLLPSTILHELFHLTAVLIFTTTDLLVNILFSFLGVQKMRVTTPINISIIPSPETGNLGVVTFKNSSNIQTIIISIFPIMWWVILFYLSIHFHYIEINNSDINFNFNHHFLKNILAVITTYYFIMAGRLSTRDMKNVLERLLTIEVIFFIILVYVIYNYLINEYTIFDDNNFRYTMEVVANKIVEITQKLF